MGLKEQMAKDLDVLLSADTFGDLHNINGVSLLAVIDDDVTTLRYLHQDQEWTGLGWRRRTLACRAADLPARPAVGSTATLDGETVYVRDTRIEEGLLVITYDLHDPSEDTEQATVIHYGADDGWSARSETGRETNIVCRFTLETSQAPVNDALQLATTAQVAFDAACGLVTLRAGDVILLASQAGKTWRVVRVTEKRDSAAQVVQRIAFVRN